MTSNPNEEVTTQILDAGILNPHTGFDVTVDEVFQYFEETQETPSLEGFKEWLTEDR